MYPTMQDRRWGLGRLVWWAFWVLVIVYVLHNPSEAAANARALGAWLTSAVDAIATFFEHATRDSQ